MLKPNGHLYKIRLMDMKVLVLLSRGMSQLDVAAEVGCHQPYIGRIVDKLSSVYKVKLTEGGKINYRLSEDGLKIAGQFDRALRVLEGKEERKSYEQVDRIAQLKIMARGLIDQAESI